MSAVDFPETNASFPFDSCNLLLGKGGSGAVFLARHHETGQLVAVKRCYARKDHHEQRASPSSHPHHHHHHHRPTSPLDASSAPPALNGGHSAVPDVGGPPLPNEVEMQEESNLEAFAISQHHDMVSALFPPPPPSQTATSPASPLPQGSPGTAARVGEATVLEYLGKHPHIVDYLGSYTSSRCVTFFAMELMDSDIGRELRSGNTALRSEEACAVFGLHILEALQHIHTRGVAHRDVKPGNVFLKRVSHQEAARSVLMSSTARPPPPLTGGPTSTLHRGGRRTDTYVKAYLGDFSAAHLLTDQGTDTTTLATRGTLFYKAPEQLLGRPIADFTALDMWALGCTLMEMATGCVAFTGASELQVLLQLLHRLGSNFSDYPAQTNTPTLFDTFGPSTQSAKLVDLLVHLLALDPAQRFTAKQALEHPFFTVVRQRQQHLAQQLHTAGSDGTVGPIPVYLKARLMSTRCPESAQLRVSFRPVAMTPYHKRQRAERERAEVQQFTTLVRLDASALRARQAHGPNDSARETERGKPVRFSHHYLEKDPEAPPTDAMGDGTSHPRVSCSPHDGNSFVSDGPSLHWSQVRSFVAGSGGEASSFLEPPSHGKQEDEQEGGRDGDDGESGDGDKRSRSRGTSGGSASPQVRTSGSGSGPFLRCCRLSFPDRVSSHTPSYSLLAGRQTGGSTGSSEGTGGRGCGRPVLVAASGTAFTASNLRAYRDFEASVSAGSGRVCSTAMPPPPPPASFRALTYSSEEPVLSPPSYTDTRTGSTSFGSSSLSSGEKAGESACAGRVTEAQARANAPPAHARKMLMFESPASLKRSTNSDSLGTMATHEACTPSAAAAKSRTRRVPCGASRSQSRNNNGDNNAEEAEGSDGVDASAILGVAESCSPHDSDIRSCCSSVTATPMDYFRAGGYLACSAGEGGAGHMAEAVSWLPAAQPPPPPLPISLMCAAGTGTGAPLASASSGATETRRAPVSTRSFASARAKDADNLSRSPGGSVLSSPRAVLHEHNLSVSQEVILSALCSPVPRQVGPSTDAIPHHRILQALPVNRRYPPPPPQQQRQLPRCDAQHSGDPFGKTLMGNEEDGPAPHRILTLSGATHATAAGNDALLRQLSTALTAATAAAQHFPQQRHCTPSLEPLSESNTMAMFDSRERSASGRFGAHRTADSISEAVSEEADEGSSNKKRSKYETPVT